MKRERRGLLPALSLLTMSLLVVRPLLALGGDHAQAQMLIDIPTASGALADSRRIDREPHSAGTPGDYALALWMEHQLIAYGFQAHLEAFRGETYAPKRLVLALATHPRPTGLELREAAITGDPQGSRPDAGLPYLAGSGDGDLTAPLVYINKGRRRDYATLARAKLDIRGKILLIRNNAQSFSELARRAQSRGAVGVIFYSDPARDGAARGAVYPNGPWRPLGSVQRGSLGYPDLKIPALPISAANALPLLRTLRGITSPESWHGAMNASYAIGMSLVPVHLEVQLNHSYTTMWNTVGTLPGRNPHEEVLLGAHRDAWAYGVTDNGSGVSALLEAARALGFLHQSGWKPERSILVIGFDGEELGELGSSWYVYRHRIILRREAVAYLDADKVATGETFYGNAAEALSGGLVRVLGRIPDPLRTTAMLSQRRDVGISAPPAGGSDFEPFLYNLGIPTAQMGFSGPFGVYHSSYDDLDYAEHFADPDFTNHRVVAQLYALAAMRLADPRRSPYRLAAYAPAMQAGLARIARNRGTLADATAPLRAAITRFGTVAMRFDRTASARDNPRALYAVHRLDLLLYGRIGYRSVAFANLARALESGDAAGVASAVSGDEQELARITYDLR